MTTTEGLSRRINEQSAALKEMREELAKADARIAELEEANGSLEGDGVFGHLKRILRRALA